MYFLCIRPRIKTCLSVCRKPLFQDRYESHESWTCIYDLSLSNNMHLTNCTTHKPLLHDSHDSNESYESWTCIYDLSLSNDIHFTNCTTRKPLFLDSYELYESCGSWTCIYTLMYAVHQLYDPKTIAQRLVRVVRVVRFVDLYILSKSL